MPFAIRKQGNKFKVVNSETGDTKGTFDNEDDAKKQLAALYANVPEARKQFTEVVIKSALAEMVPVEGDESDDGPGHFHAIISSQKRDRDGDQLWADEWEQPLPDHIVINGDHDNNHIMSTIGSGTPTLESDNKIHVRGTYAETDFAQDSRKLVNGKHLRTLSCAYREKRGEKGVKRELVNASFVLVPSNTDCVVVDSKSYELPTPLDVALRSKADDGKKPYGDVTYADPGYQADDKKRYPLDTEQHVRAAWSYINQGDNSKPYSSEQLSSIKSKIRSAAKKFGIDISEDSKEFDELTTKQVDVAQMTPQERAQAVHDLAVDMGADCATFSDLMADEMKSFLSQYSSSSSSALDQLSKLDLEVFVDEDRKELTVKHSGNVLGTHKFSQAPEAHGDEPSDSTADPAKDAEALARAKAAVLQMETRHLVNIEGD